MFNNEVFKVICEDSRQPEAEFRCRKDAESHLVTTSYPVARWIEVTDICGWCDNDNIDASGRSMRESDGCCGHCGAI